MEKVNFAQSTKNIAVPDKTTFLHMLISSADKFLHNARWKAHFFLKPSNSKGKETFDFKSTKAAPHVQE